jgi:hypothetical protein
MAKMMTVTRKMKIIMMHVQRNDLKEGFVNLHLSHVRKEKMLEIVELGIKQLLVRMYQRSGLFHLVLARRNVQKGLHLTTVLSYAMLYGADWLTMTEELHSFPVSLRSSQRRQ